MKFEVSRLEAITIPVVAQPQFDLGSPHGRGVLSSGESNTAQKLLETSVGAQRIECGS